MGLLISGPCMFVQGEKNDKKKVSDDTFDHTDRIIFNCWNGNTVTIK